MKALALGVLLAIAGAIKALFLRYKAELAAAAVVGLSLHFASALDRGLIIGAVAASFILGHKMGSCPVAPPSS